MHLHVSTSVTFVHFHMIAFMWAGVLDGTVGSLDDSLATVRAENDQRKWR